MWYFTENGLGKPGLTVFIQHFFKNGTEIISVSGSSVSALGGGLYRFLFSGSNVNVIGDYEAVAFITGTADMNNLPCRLDVFSPIQDLVLDTPLAPHHIIPGTGGEMIYDTYNLVGSIPDSGANAQALLDSDVTVHNFPNTVGLFINKIFSLDDTIEGTLTLRKIIKLIASALFGKSFGGGTANVGFRDTQDTKNRISATVDANGNRTNVTLDGS